VDEDQFWTLIADSRAQEPGGGERLADALGNRLRQLSADEIFEFGRHWYAVMDRLYTWPIWDAAIVLLGWVADDSFRDVRAWIVTHGQAAVDQVVANPDELADLAQDQEHAFVEAFDGIVYKSYRAVTGHDPVYPPSGGSIDPSGERTNLKDAEAVAARFPRLAELARAQPKKAPIDLSAVVWAPDDIERCPRCDQSLTRMSIKHVSLVGGMARRPQEFRACTGCFDFAVRVDGSNDWAAAEPTEVPDMARITFRRP
jgi:hypothetical protein